MLRVQPCLCTLKLNEAISFCKEKYLKLTADALGTARARGAFLVRRKKLIKGLAQARNRC
jgi:hypothetical protein